MRTVVAGLFIGAVVAIAQQDGVTPAGKVFTSGDGVQMRLVYRLPNGSKKGLVQFVGTTSKHEGHVFEVEISERDGAADYTTRWEKRPYNMVVMRQGNYEGYLPDVKGAISLRYDDKKSETLDTKALWASFKQQK